VRAVDVAVHYWHVDIDSLEAICQDEETRRLLLRLAVLSRSDTVAPFLIEVARAGGLDDELRESVAELACDSSLLHTVEDYVRRTQRLH
jgi:hypothetical protein